MDEKLKTAHAACAVCAGCHGLVVFSNALTLSETPDFKLFHIETVYRRQF